MYFYESKVHGTVPVCGADDRMYSGRVRAEAGSRSKAETGREYKWYSE